MDLQNSLLFQPQWTTGSPKVRYSNPMDPISMCAILTCEKLSSQNKATFSTLSDLNLVSLVDVVYDLRFFIYQFCKEKAGFGKEYRLQLY